MAKVRQVAKSATERGRSSALEMTDDETAAEIGEGIGTTKMETGPTNAGGDQGHDRRTVTTSASIHTDIGPDHAQENTEDIDREVTSAGVRTIVTGLQKTASMDAREARDETRGVAIAAGAAAGRRTSTRNHAEEASIELERIRWKPCQVDIISLLSSTVRRELSHLTRRRI